jgi:cation-transporting ATPase 13A1
MTTIVTSKNFSSPSLNRRFVVSKGAPEIFETLQGHKVPSNYREQYLKLAEEGFRLLSLFARPLDNTKTLEIPRNELETGLEFQGFLILENRLKKDTPRYITKFANAGKMINILSGDNLFTCVKTYKALNLDEQDFFQLILNNSQGPLTLKSVGPASPENIFPENFDLNITKKTNIPSISMIPTRINLCTDGKSLAHLLTVIEESKSCAKYRKGLLTILARLRVIGRVSPTQKELYINLLRKFYGEDSAVLMCGDGNNDVGALKSADVGIALVGLNDQPTKKQIEEVNKKRREEQIKAFKSRKRFDTKKFEEEFGLFDTQDVKFGDASIAAPFTNKISNSIKCVGTIIKQGVCTLVCGFQTYKIVTLTSLISAYTMSTLHLENLRFSDYQNTYLGLYGAILNYFLTNGSPEKNIPKVRPPGTIRNIFFWINLLGQLFFQLYFSYWVIEFGKQYSTDEDLDVNNEEEFTPTFLNSVTFIYNMAATFCIYVCNYEGYPFMKPLSNSKLKLLFALSPIYLIYILCSEPEGDLGQMFQLDMNSSTSEDAGNELFNKMVIMIFGSIIWAYICKTLRLRMITRII